MGLEALARKLYPPGIPTELELPDWRVQDLLRRAQEVYPDQEALVFYQARWTYRQLWEDANRFARVLYDRGVKPGDRIALMLPNSPQYVIAYYGTLIAGGIVAQVNPLLVERELQELLVDSGSRAIIAFDGVLPRVEKVRANAALEIVIGVRFQGSAAAPGVEDFNAVMASAPAAMPQLPPVLPADVAVLQYTGGTTGRSKGAMLTHRNLVANVLQVRLFAEFYEGEEQMLTVLPLFHVYGMTCMNLGIHLAATLVLFPRFDLKEVLGAIKDYRITLWPGVPTMYTALLQVPDLANYGVDSIRICNSGSAPMPVELMQRFQDRTGAAILEGYGLSEASPVTHTNPAWGERKPGTVGMPLPSTEFRIVDPDTLTDVTVGELGELWVRGPQVMKGYWNQPEDTAAALVDGGWLRTGDLAASDADGYVSIMDRLKDLIIASGYNVYPREIEEVIYQHPDVLEAVVVGVPDEYRGETVRAVIVPKPGSGLTIEAMEQYFKDNLAAYKRPKIIEFRDALPKSAVGKILRRVVRGETRA